MFTRCNLMSAVLLAVPMLTSNTAIAQEDPGIGIGTSAVIQGNGACPSFELAPRLGITPAVAAAPGIWEALTGVHGRVYETLFRRLWPEVTNLTTRASTTRDQATYQSLLNLANSIANAAVGRLLITLPDGTVVIDTARNDGPGDARNNYYLNFVAKTINENHNSRIAILSAQLYPCGIGVESKRSTSTGRYEHYVAIRLGKHLDNQGTARLSVTP